MPKFKTHLTALEHSAATSPSAPALKIPFWSSDGKTFEGWKDITFSQLLGDVEKAARYWAHELGQSGLKERSVVGLWIKGMSYMEAVHIWGISRAGYIPQLISIRLTSLVVVRELLDEANAKALIFDPSVGSILTDELPKFPAIDLQPLDLSHLPLPELWYPSEEDEIIMVFHSSGSTSGRPKLVPLTVKWLEYNIGKTRHISVSKDHGAREVLNSGGSFCHSAASLCLLTFVERGGCLLLPSKIPFSSNELQRMVKEGGVNMLNLFSSFLGGMIKESRKNADLLDTLRSLPACYHSGLPMEAEEADWAREQGINLIDVFASTEVGCMMMSNGGKGPEAQFVRPFPGTSYKFSPLSDSSATVNGAGEQLLEIVIPKESPDCPHHSLRKDQNSDFATGDLVVEVAPGQYLLKGRIDNWIKMQVSLRCDTKSIEDNAMELCAKDLISTAVAVGSGRQSPALYVEPSDDLAQEFADDAPALQKEILHRITPFHEKRYLHERIDDARLIIVVPRLSLPRTGKGSIQRKVVERDFQENLDLIYSTVYH